VCVRAQGGIFKRVIVDCDVWRLQNGGPEREMVVARREGIFCEMYVM